MLASQYPSYFLTKEKSITLVFIFSLRWTDFLFLLKPAFGLEQQDRLLTEWFSWIPDASLSQVRALLEVKEEFRVIIDDPSGNSFLENPFAPAAGNWVYNMNTL